MVVQVICLRITKQIFRVTANKFDDKISYRVV